MATAERRLSIPYAKLIPLFPSEIIQTLSRGGGEGGARSPRIKTTRASIASGDTTNSTKAGKEAPSPETHAGGLVVNFQGQTVPCLPCACFDASTVEVEGRGTWTGPYGRQLQVSPYHRLTDWIPIQPR